MNILIKLTCLIGLVLAPILGGHSVEEIPNLPDETSVIQTEESKPVANGTYQVQE